ncbi:hypothetical protein L1987_16504 [Smallanthus sonchifolius]|uniref:Uncharacterized protein n=1 Tax=Smallanthus sonchifolius TaxID=185202 RepID=A0ACB9J9D3_9ASTR|nr:hypothetical protein L1987_16504 [Smallanthus sonchifolius]
MDMDCDRPDEDVDQSVDLISLGFNQQLDLQYNEDHKDCENEEEDDDDDDFTFMLIGQDEAPSYDDKMFEDGRIRPVFPLFDQNLLIDGEYDIEEIDRLPILPPVDKIFIESPRGFPSSTVSKHEGNEDAASGPYCEWSKDSANAATELSKKSNSTGFSKLWRLREKVGRSNSDGRDSFVFMKSSVKLMTSTTTSSSSKPVINDGTFVKVNGGKARVVKQGTKAKKSTVSAHEAYLRSRGHTEEDRRRSYLPYRPELMGLFTNVHGGLSKNVHPY